MTHSPRSAGFAPPRAPLAGDPEVAGRTPADLRTGTRAPCLVAVIVLSVRWCHSSPPPGAGRPTGLAVLNVVAVLQPVVGLLALTLLGAFQSANALQVFLATMVVSVAVLVLGVGLARHVSRMR